MNPIREGSSPWLMGGAIGLVALLCRAVYVAAAGESPLFTVSLVADDGVYGAALGLLDGRYIALKWIQAVLGAVNCVLVWRLGSDFFGSVPGAVAGVFAAFYGPLIYYGAELGPAIWTICFALAGLVAVGGGRSGLAGLLLGAACALSGQMLVLALVVLHRLEKGWGRASLLFAVGLALGLVPVWWTIDTWLPDWSTLRPEALLSFWHGGEWTGQRDPYLAVEHTALTYVLWQRGLAFPFGLIGPLALWGIYRVWRSQDTERSQALWLVGACVAGSMLYGGDAGMRIIVVPLLLVFAGWAVTVLWPVALDRRSLALQLAGLAVLVVACNLGGDTQRVSSTANERYARGMAYESLQMSANSIREYEQAMATGVAPVATHAALGRLYKGSGAYARAIGAYRAWLQEEAGDGRARAELAQTLILAERASEAVAEYRILSEEEQDGDRFLGMLGDAQLMTGDSDGALMAYKKMAAARPDSARVLYHLARLYEAEGFKAEALETYRRLREQAPWRIEAGWRAAALLAEQGAGEEAEVLLRSVLAEDANNQPALWGLGRMLAVDGRYEEALPLFERLQGMDPQDYRPYFFLGKLYFRLEREAEAERAFEQYQIVKRRAEMKQSAEENIDAVLRQFGDLGE